MAFVSVVIRPFSWEAGGLLQLLSALEGVSLAVILRKRRGALRRLPRIIRFVIGVPSFNNLGLFARERTQVFQFVLVCICVAATSAAREADAAQVRPLAPARPVTA